VIRKGLRARFISSYDLTGVVTRGKNVVRLAKGGNDIKRERKRKRERGIKRSWDRNGMRTDQPPPSSRGDDEVKKADDGAITRPENGAW